MSNSSIFIDPLFPLWWIAFLMIPLFSFLIWKEVKRSLRYLPLRILAQFFVLISILGLLLRPGFVERKNSSGVILLTQGYHETVVDSLLHAHPDLTVLRLPETNPYHGSELLTSFNSLNDIDSEIQFVLGEGLPTFALEMMDQKRFQFFPVAKQIGIVQFYLPELVKVNQQNEVRGMISTEGQTTLTLLGPGGKEDSVTMKKDGVAPFSLMFKPKQPGLFVYSLVYQDKLGTHTHQIPVAVTEEEKLNILFLQKFPSFEVRHLKNFLAEKGNRIALRYQVSKNNFKFEFANLPISRINAISSSLLQKYDLVITDHDGLEALSAIEKNTLEESVRNGLGMILFFNQANEKDKQRERFLSVDFKKISKDTANIRLPMKQYNLPALSLLVNETRSIFPVTRNRNRILSGYAYTGLGKTGFQLLQETYRISLEGNAFDYAAIWSNLLEKCARTSHESFKIRVKTEFPLYEDEPLQVEVISSVDKHPTLIDDQVVLPLTENVQVDDVWLGKTWAGKPGWHVLSADSSTLHYFVSRPTDWKSLRVANQVKQNEIESVSTSQTSEPETVYQKKRISILFFYLLFLLASGYLWLSPKI